MSPTAVTKPVLPPLQTPRTASFPSEMCSTPISACMSAVMKHEADLRTPITPPTAYTDFLKALTPMLASPPPTALNRTLSDDSNVSTISNPSTGSSFSGRSTGDSFKSPTSVYPVPPTPQSATLGQKRSMSGLKRLSIPQRYSPIFSPTTGPSPRTGLSSAQSALYSPFSPADWSSRGMFETVATPRSACSKAVSVRSVVTRTVTYKRTTPNLEPAPRGKRRKTTSTSTTSSVRSSTADASSEDEVDKMPPPPLISIKESTPEGAEKIKSEVKSEPENIIPSAIPATAAEA